MTIVRRRPRRDGDATLIQPGTIIQPSRLPRCNQCGEPAHLVVPLGVLLGDADLVAAAAAGLPTCWRHFRGKDYRSPDDTGVGQEKIRQARRAAHIRATRARARARQRARQRANA